MARLIRSESESSRSFEEYDPVVLYECPPTEQKLKTTVEKKWFKDICGGKVKEFFVEKKSAKAFELLKGDLCRITVIEGPQVADLNLWNKHNTKERFYSGKTRQLHSSHLKVFDRLWSNLPYLNPMATFVYDTLACYGVDKDGASLHDVVGTRCDNYTYKLISGKETKESCHQYITEAIKQYGLGEMDVHDVWNVFMCTGFTKDTQKYFSKPTPARKGDYIDFIAEMDLIVALSACPMGDVSTPFGEEVPEDRCYPLGVEIFREHHYYY